MKITKQQIWNQLDKPTKEFVKSLTEVGFTIKAVKNKDNYWRKS